MAYDPSIPYETLTIDVGSANTSERGRIRVGQWVAAGVTVDSEEQNPSGRRILSQQWLLGKIIEVGLFSSRVQLASDPRFGPIRVQVAMRLADGALAPDVKPGTRVARLCSLEGLGRGRMTIRHARDDYLETGFDHVLVPAGVGLPAAMLIGRVAASQPLEDAPLWFALTVEAPAEYKILGRVYVIAAGS